jgi:hypothetical protein
VVDDDHIVDFDASCEVGVILAPLHNLEVCIENR